MADRQLDYWDQIEEERRERREKSRIKTQEPLVLITALFRRWSGATQEEILDQERMGELLPFDREKTILLPSGQKEHWLQPGGIRIDSWNGEINITDAESVFLESNIREIEKKRPDFLCPMVTLEDRPYLAAKKIENPLPWYQNTLADVRAELDKNKEQLAEAESALATQKAENEKLKARIAELENTPQRGAESEEITSLRWELGKLRMALEDSENARLGLSDELEVKTLELARLRQELEEVSTGRGENPSLPTNIKTVLRMLQEQKSDREIAQALYNGGGNSGMSQAQVKALLWRGDEFPAEQSIKNAMKELFLSAGKSTL